MKRLVMLAALAACGPNARAPAASAFATPLASGYHVRLPHWFQVDFPAAVEESKAEVQTDAGTLPFREFTSKSATVFAQVRVVEAPGGFSTSKENLLASTMGKPLDASNVLHEGAFLGADTRFVASPHSADNPSAFTIACRRREFLSDTKLVVGIFCGGPRDPAVDRAADSLHALE